MSQPEGNNEALQKNKSKYGTLNRLLDFDAVVRGDVHDDEEALKSVSTDYSHIHIRPDLAVFPRDSSDIKALVRRVSELKPEDPKLSITTRSGGADVSGGPLNESIILDVSRHMNHMVELREDQARVQPGMLYRDFDVATKALGSFLPPYPASRDICCLGGMAGNNSGGPKTFSYGKVEDFVKSLNVVLADGQEYKIEPLNEEQLAGKMRLEDFEGKLYREMFKLISDNYGRLQEAKPKVSKNSSGYFLWNVWDREKGIFDLTRLLVGSQSTLGIITEMNLRLVRFRPKRKIMVVFLNDLKHLSEIVQILAQENPEELEMYHQSVMKVILRHYPTFAATLKVNPFTFGFQFHEETLELFKAGDMTPEALILPKFAGDTEEEVDEQIERARKAIAKFNLPVHITETDADREKYRKLRHDTFYFFQNHLGGKEEITFFDDLCVKPEHLSEFIPKILKVIERCGCEYFLAGHIGNGNVHMIPFMDPTSPEDQERIRKMTDDIYNITLSYGGTISGEHNDGLTRTPYIKRMFGEDVYGLFEQTKRIFDPQCIFNPGKKVATEKTKDLQYTFDHMLAP